MKWKFSTVNIQHKIRGRRLNWFQKVR